MAASFTAPPNSITATNNRGKKAKAIIANNGAIMNAITTPLITAQREYKMFENFSPIDY